MKVVIFLVIIFVVGGAGPPILEGRANACAAFESQVVTSDANGLSQAIASAGVSVTNGEMGRAFARRRYPNLPTGISCSLLYWFALMENTYG